jgi:phenylalanyl-tRNA synthetase beta chain
MFVVVEILEISPLSNLFSVKVFDGTSEFMIVSAAKNLKIGMKTIVAKVGSLVDDEEIICKTISNVKSEGMICDNKVF